MSLVLLVVGVLMLNPWIFLFGLMFRWLYHVKYSTAIAVIVFALVCPILLVPLGLFILFREV